MGLVLRRDFALLPVLGGMHPFEPPPRWRLARCPHSLTYCVFRGLWLLCAVLRCCFSPVRAAGVTRLLWLLWLLQRDLDKDAVHMQRMMKAYSASRQPYMLLLFPEGTDLSPENLVKSDTFAEKNGLPKLRQTLHPRTKGFWLCLDSLLGSVDEIWDVSLAYAGPMPQKEAAMVRVCASCCVCARRARC